MTCVHRWVLASPNGPTVEGVCKHCGATRTYDSAGPDYRVYGHPPSEEAKRRAANRAAEARLRGTKR